MRIRTLFLIALFGLPAVSNGQIRVPVRPGRTPVETDGRSRPTTRAERAIARCRLSIYTNEVDHIRRTGPRPLGPIQRGSGAAHEATTAGGV